VTKPNEPAYPFVVPDCGCGDAITRDSGMTKRELFAAMAMQGMAIDGELPYDSAARMAVKYADALIAELAKEQP